jgi:hypothetical protein
MFKLYDKNNICLNKSRKCNVSVKSFSITIFTLMNKCNALFLVLLIPIILLVGCNGNESGKIIEDHKGDSLKSNLGEGNYAMYVDSIFMKAKTIKEVKIDFLTLMKEHLRATDLNGDNPEKLYLIGGGGDSRDWPDNGDTVLIVSDSLSNVLLFGEIREKYYRLYYPSDKNTLFYYKEPALGVTGNKDTAKTIDGYSYSWNGCLYPRTK